MTACVSGLELDVCVSRERGNRERRRGKERRRLDRPAAFGVSLFRL
jgi:hypothetical protein